MQLMSGSPIRGFEVMGITSFYILSFIELKNILTQGGKTEPIVYVCVCACVLTFLNARPDRTRGPIFLRYGTQTKMLITECQVDFLKYYGMRQFYDVTVTFFFFL